MTDLWDLLYGLVGDASGHGAGWGYGESWGAGLGGGGADGRSNPADAVAGWL